MGASVMLLIFLLRILKLFRLIRTAPSYPVEKFTILETPKEEQSSFSFFNFIFIGNASELSEHERSLIIDHERVHAQRLHSFDVLLTNFLGIIFWFNPVVKIYKNTFVHLHEYEADARTVKYHDVNDYCSLLAKVALLSADIRLASHFSNSLTLKRIEMIRKIRSKIKWWKVALIMGAIPLFFFAVSCQDQLVNDRDTRDPITILDTPAPILVLERFEALKKAKPNSTFILVEFDEEGTRLIEKMEKAHGVPASIELFTPDNERYKNSVMNTEPEKITFNQSNVWDATAGGTRTFAIIEYRVKKVSSAEDDNRVYTVVDDTATPENGMPAFYEEIAQKIFYPKEARMKGIEGKVYVEFIVEKDGTVSNIRAIKGIGAGCDEAAVMVIKTMSSKWVPGKLGGIPVKQSMVLPVTFKLAGTAELKGSDKVVRMEDENLDQAIEELVVVGYEQN
jgi:TonB family protein